MTPCDRRQFLEIRRRYAAPLLSPRDGFMPCPPSGPRLLVVFLRGAYDAANIVVPVSSDFYYASRPNLAIPKDAALPLDSDWGLHPALKDSIYPLWQKKQIAFVPFAGTDDTSARISRPRTRSNWASRLAGTPRLPVRLHEPHRRRSCRAPRPIAFTTQLPLTFRGGAARSQHRAEFHRQARRGRQERRTDPGHVSGPGPGAGGGKASRCRTRSIRRSSAEMQAANRNAVTPKGFELSAQRIGILMQDKFNLGFVDVGGWDTHVNQGGADGYLADRIGELGRGLALLQTTLGPPGTTPS